MAALKTCEYIFVLVVLALTAIWAPAAGAELGRNTPDHHPQSPGYGSDHDFVSARMAALRQM